MSEPEDPPRWSNDGAVPPRLSQLFSAAQHDVATNQELAELGTRLGPQLDAAAAPAKAFSRLASWGGGALVAAAVVGTMVYVWAHRAPSAVVPAPQRNVGTAETTASRFTSQAASATQPSSSAIFEQRAPFPTVSITPTPREKPSAAAAHSAVSTASNEAALLERARGALATNPAQALALTQEHTTRFSRGLLIQEREVIAISALRRLGRNAEAERRAARFDALFPGSAHQQTVNGTAP